MHNNAQILVITLLSVLFAIPASADDVDEGVKAAQNGDFELAFELFLEPAELGNAYAQYNLGIMYSKGEGVAQDYAEAAKWYVLAAEQGDTISQFNLGTMYDYGQGVAQDYA